MKILISACLLGRNCKYSGGHNREPALLKILKGHELLPLCPEVLGGLSIPRRPAEIREKEGRFWVINDLGQDVTRYFVSGAQKSWQLALEEQICFAILKEGSPSCGVHQIYDGSFSGRKIKGQGIFAKLLENQGIPCFSEWDLPQIEMYLGK